MGALLVLSATCISGHAAQIAEFNFDDETGMDSVGSSDLNSVGAAPDFSKQAYFSDGDESNYLQVGGPGGQPAFSVSLWVNTAFAAQGDRLRGRPIHSESPE